MIITINLIASLHLALMQSIPYPHFTGTDSGIDKTANTGRSRKIHLLAR